MKKGLGAEAPDSLASPLCLLGLSLTLPTFLYTYFYFIIYILASDFEFFVVLAEV